MYDVLIARDGAASRSERIDRFPCRIGRGSEADLTLAGWRVARVHAELQRIDGGLRIVDCGSLVGTWVNGERVAEFGPLDERDEILIAGYRLVVQPERSANTVIDALGQDALAADGNHSRGRSLDRRDAVAAEEATDGRSSIHAPATSEAEPAVASHAPVDAHAEQMLYWQRTLHRRLLASIDLHRREIRQLSAEQLRSEMREILEQIVSQEEAPPQGIDSRALIDAVLDEAVGLGPLEALLADETVSEIMVNGSADIYVERNGLLSRSSARFSDDHAVRAAIDRIVAPIGRRIDESSPMVDARLADGSRVNAVLPPLALRGPTITIRRFNRRLLTPDDLVAIGTLSDAMLAFLRLCVQYRRNIVVSGGTGSGKTTLLNVLSNLIPAGERVITIEDAAELRLAHAHLVALEARPANVEGRGQVSIRDLVRNALRMRPDRIVVGECRGGEALDMLQAMNTGHDGSLTTVHANAARDVLSRLETMVLMSGVEMPVSAIREQVAGAVDVIVHQARMPDGRRRVVEIAEITGIEGARILMQPLFRFARGEGGGFRACGNLPHCLEELRELGVAVDPGLFMEAHHADA